MNKTYAIALGLATMLVTTAAAHAAQDVVQAPRDQDVVQAPRGQDQDVVQAPRG